MNDENLAIELEFDKELERELTLIRPRLKTVEKQDRPTMFKKCSLREYEKKYGVNPTNSFEEEH